VPRLVYLTSATRELARIASDLEDAGQSRSAALAFIDKLTDYCEHLARLPGLLGRARPELRPEYRSATFASYVIFFRYFDGSAPARSYGDHSFPAWRARHRGLLSPHL